MPLVTRHRWTAASLVPDWLQREDDGAFTLANLTDLSLNSDRLMQTNGTIGDGPFGSTSGDFDVFLVRVTPGRYITVDVDAQILGSSLDATIAVYSSTGTLIASNENDPAGGLDPFVAQLVGASDSELFFVVIGGTGSQLTNLDDSASGTGAGSTGFYRVFISSNVIPLAGDIDPSVLHGTNGAETINGDAGGDVIVGNGGADTLNGGIDNDLFIWKPGDGNDVVHGDDGFDVQEVDASSNSETFVLSASFFGTTNIFGGAGIAGGDVILSMNNVEGFDLRALSGNDTLVIQAMAGTALTGRVKFWGGGGNDVVNGAAALNPLTLNGGLGRDKLIAGTDADVFDFDFKADSKVGSHRDVIVGFDRSEDLIDLSDIDARSRVGGDQAFKFIGLQSFHHRAGELHYFKNGGVVVVEGDTNGDGRADFQIQVNGIHGLTAGDFDL